MPACLSPSLPRRLVALWFVYAEAASAATPLSPVTVQAVTGRVIAGYDQLQAGRRSFQAHHSLAPEARLRFVLDDAGADPARPPPLQFLSDRMQLDVPLEEGRYFRLGAPVPALHQGRLLAARSSGRLQIHPLVRDPDSDPLVTRLGDLRLECEVSWSIGKSSAPLWMRGAFAMAGGVCHSSHIQAGLYSPRAIQSVTLSEQGHSASFKAGPNHHDYQLPLYDRHWSDRALVRFQAMPTRMPSS